jgi:putative transposase
VLLSVDLPKRRVLVGGVTSRAADAAWCVQIARNLTDARERRVELIRHLVHDRDTRFSPVFDKVFRAEGIEIIRTPWRTPKANA